MEFALRIPKVIAALPFVLPAALALTPPAIAQDRPDANTPAAISPVPGDETSETLAAEMRDDRLTLAVDIGDHGPFDFLVDTGSEATVVSSRVAEKLGLVADTQRTVVGIGGSSTTDEVWLDELVVGHHRIHDLPATVIEERHIGAAGIIGIESLGEQRLTLDFAAREITLAPSPGRIKPRHNEIVVRARTRAKRLIVQRATLAGHEIDVVIDTGSSFTIGNTALRHRFFRKAPVVTQTHLTDVLGNRSPVGIINAGELLIERLSIRDTHVAIADTAIFEELGLTERPALLLGMNHLQLFRRVAVDFHRRQVLFELNG